MGFFTHVHIHFLFVLGLFGLLGISLGGAAGFGAHGAAFANACFVGGRAFAGGGCRHGSAAESTALSVAAL